MLLIWQRTRKVNSRTGRWTRKRFIEERENCSMRSPVTSLLWVHGTPTKSHVLSIVNWWIESMSEWSLSLACFLCFRPEARRESRSHLLYRLIALLDHRHELGRKKGTDRRHHKPYILFSFAFGSTSTTAIPYLTKTEHKHTGRDVAQEGEIEWDQKHTHHRESYAC